MRRVARIAFVTAALTLCCFSQEPAHPRPDLAEKVDKVADEGNFEYWKWANFAILAVLLYWFVSKNAPAFFRARTAEIQKGIAEASQLRAEADARAASMETRMAALQSEIEQVRAESAAIMANEAERLRQETEKSLVRVMAHGQQEIEAATKHAQKDLRAYSAQLAIQLATERIRQRMSGGAQDRLFDQFVHQLDKQTGEGARL